ncbi:hypothetical protein AB6D11_18615 [Vibrio splendidus]
MSEKSMLDSFNVVDENGESQFQTVDELGNLNNFYVNVPWDEVREKIIFMATERPFTAPKTSITRPRFKALKRASQL